MDACRPSSKPQLPAKASLISYSLKLDTWSDLLARHPDRAFTAYILDEICQGFRIGLEYSRHICFPAKKNMQSAADVPQEVSRYPDMECRLGSVVILDDESAQSVQTSPFGLIPKWGKLDDWHLIPDLSSPLGHSVNDGINPARCSLKYASIDQAVCICRSLGEALLSGHQKCLLHGGSPPQRSPLAGYALAWSHLHRHSTALHTALHSEGVLCCRRCITLGDAPNGVMHGLYYLDNFLSINPAGTSHDNSQLRIALHTCQLLGVPAAPDKIHEPSNVLTFLGIEIDSTSLQLRLPEPKLIELRQTLERWHAKKFVHQVGTLLSGWTAPPCLCSGQARNAPFYAALLTSPLL